MKLTEKQEHAKETLDEAHRLGDWSVRAVNSMKYIVGAQAGMAIFMWFVPETSVLTASVIFLLSIVAYLTALLLAHRWSKREEKVQTEAFRLVSEALKFEEADE